MIRLLAFVLFFMVSCAPIGPQDTATRAVTNHQALPPMKAFAGATGSPSTRANFEIAQDFLDLTFRMESGREVPTLTRFDGPITVRLIGPAPPTMTRDLTALLSRLRIEAGLDITMTDASDAADITVEAVPQASLQRIVPGAACFVVPRLRNWVEFVQARNGPAVDWTTLQKRERAAVFVPSDAAPQEIRDCLHEELAQALGPLNDLYRLPDSVFNDDNIHTVLTGFDMLILRTTYAPELQNGMTRRDVLRRLPAILARLNPQGQHQGGRPPVPTSRAWIDAMNVALSNDSSPTVRRAAARQAITLGHSSGWDGPREGFAFYAYGRLQVGNNPDTALSAFNAAEAIYRRNPATEIHAAHIAVQKAAYALAAGDAQSTLSLVESAIPVAEAHENAALMSTLMMFKAEALSMMDNPEAAARVRLDSLGWARYGFGADETVTARLAEIAALRPY